MKTISELHHILSEHKPIPKDINLWPESWRTIEYKDYSKCLPVSIKAELLQNLEKEQSFLVKILRSRISGESFRVIPTIEEILFLLQNTCGEKDSTTGKRPYPSGGALYPLEIYYVTTIAEKQTLYHFSQVKNELRLIKKDTHFDYKVQVCDKDVSSYCIITYLPKRNSEKYTSMGLRLAYTESGSLSQTISILGEAMGLKTRIIAGFNEDKISELLEIKNSSEFPLLVIPIAKKI